MAQVELQRTAAELKEPAYNYFLAFKIDPKETDPTKIGDAIKKALSTTSGSVLTRRLIELKNDIMEIMCNDSVFAGGTYTKGKGGRKAEAAAAVKYKIDEAVEVIEIMCQTRKSLLKSDLLDVCATANKPVVYFTEAEFMARLKYLTDMGVKIIDNVDTKIPFSDFQQIEKKLEPLGNKTLYEFLGVSPTVTTAEIKTASDNRYREGQRLSDLKKKQSISTLCGDVKKILLDSADKRKAYDQYLVLKDDVWDDFAKRKLFGLKELKLEEYEAYTQKVMELLKVSVDEAEKILAIGCKFFQFVIAGKSDGNTFEKCPFPDCGKLYVKGAKSCPHCGKSLEELCWNCHAQVRISKDDKGCPTCGATRHAHELFNQKCQELDRLLARPDATIAQMQSALLGVKNVVPNYAARKESAVAKKVQDYDRTIGDRIKQEETVGEKYRAEVTKIRGLTAKRCYQSALGAAKSLPVKFNSYNLEASRKLIAEIEGVITKAQTFVNQAKQYMAQNNVNMAVSTAIKALDICDDMSDARQILQKYPPRAIVGLRVEVLKDKVKLSWDEPCKQEFVSYTVIKKIGLAPKTPDDGAVVDSGISVKFFEDASIVPATPYYYAVFCERYGVRSPIVASQTPATVYPDVVNMQQKVVEGGVTVTWDAPQNVKAIEVWRNPGTVAPTKPGEGVKIEANTNGFTDGKCSAESAYLVVCAYNNQGKTVYSNGVRAVYKPYEQISPLANPEVKPLGGGRYSFTCASGYNGKIKLYYAVNKLAVPIGSTLKFLDFNKICKGLTAIETMAGSGGELTFALPGGKIYQVYAMVCTEQLFIVSPPQAVNTLAGMTGCAFTMRDGTVSITGTLDAKARSVVAKVSNSAFVAEPTAPGEKFVFRAADFKTNGKIELKLKTNTLNYITLFAEYCEDGVTTYSQPVRLGSEPIDYREAVRVRFALHYDANPTKAFKVTIEFEADSEVELPTLLLMKGRSKPINKNDGQLCERVEGVTLKKGLFSKVYSAKKVITVQPTAVSTKFALFVNDEATGGWVQMREVADL